MTDLSGLTIIPAGALRVGDVCAGSGAEVIRNPQRDPYAPGVVVLGVRYRNGDERLVSWRYNTNMKVDTTGRVA
jgi:hypothetical protein